jgi:tetratricopeptide (TPR) repeat protein
VTGVAAWVLTIVLAAVPSEAVSRLHFQRAQKSFAQHDYRRALDEFTTANENATAELPELYFDIAQCHRNLGHARLAVLAFQHYLALRPDAPDRAQVRAMIVQLGGRAPAEDPAPRTRPRRRPRCSRPRRARSLRAPGRRPRR